MTALSGTLSLPDESVEPGDLFVRYSEEALNLRITERILSEVQLRLFTDSSPLFDVGYVKQGLHNLKTLPQHFKYDEFLQIEFLLKQEIQLWRNLLEERDRRIETYHLRRFFDNSGNDFDNNVFLSLAYFYRSSSFYQTKLSKFDLVLTRLFTKEKDTAQREICLKRERRIEHLTELFATWDGRRPVFGSFSPNAAEAIRGLDAFIEETAAFESFEDLARSAIFDRLRLFKTNLGNDFFDPAVTAVAVECNLVVGNAFNRLLAEANQSLGSRLTARTDFAGAFCDTSPAARADILEQLRNVQFESRKSPSAKGLENIWEELKRICDSVGPETEASAGDTRATAHDRLDPYFFTLCEPEPDQSLLAEYVRNSKTLWSIDLSTYVRPNVDDLVEKLCREILFVLFWTDEICEGELRSEQPPVAATVEELRNLTESAQDLTDRLEQMLGQCDPQTQNRLLLVSNKLLESRLRLERSLTVYRHSDVLARFRQPQTETSSPTSGAGWSIVA